MGVTWTYLEGRRDKTAYANDCANDLRLLLRAATQNVQTKDSLVIAFDKELDVCLYVRTIVFYLPLPG